MTKYPSQLQDKFNLRLPDGMRDAIAERAKTNGRSMNSEIVQILQEALDMDSAVANAREFSTHEEAMKGVQTQDEKDAFISNLSKTDAFAAALLKEQDEYHSRITKILTAHMERQEEKGP